MPIIEIHVPDILDSKQQDAATLTALIIGSIQLAHKLKMPVETLRWALTHEIERIYGKKVRMQNVRIKIVSRRKLPHKP